MAPARACENCGKEAKNKCSGCSKAWYCSPECQKGHWIEHLLKCNLKREVTTADHLALGVHKNLVPSDEQTLIDYGFKRALTVDKQSHLLGLYVGLIHVLGVKPRTLHGWRLKGSLAQEIHAKYAGTSVATKALYYNWFLLNPWVLDGNVLSQDDINNEFGRPAWDYVHRGRVPAPADINKVVATWPKHRTMCFHMVAMSLNRMHPAALDNMWVQFGFCTCNEESELELGGMYYSLLQDVGFEEFFDAFKSSRLVELFQSKGYGQRLEQYPFLIELLHQSPSCPSAWDLKQLVINYSEGSNTFMPSVVLDYGLINCKTGEEERTLKDAYLSFFKKPDADPPALHRACLKGEIFKYLSTVVKLKNRKMLERLMKNQHTRKV